MPKDETYIIDLCDQVLGCRGLRQYRFPFLLGDPNKSGRQTGLRVDAYYPELRLVIEYCERQHFEGVSFWDRKSTVSGVPRGEQRWRYDQRRRVMLPQNRIRLLELKYEMFQHNSRKRLLRTAEDSAVIQQAFASGSSS